MTEEFNLSDREDIVDMTYDREDVKEFIRLLNEYIYKAKNWEDFQNYLNKIAGNKLR